LTRRELDRLRGQHPRLEADAENPQKFYAFTSRAGGFYASTNGAESFAVTESGLPVAEGFGGGFGAGSDGGNVSVAPGREGDVWISIRSAGLFHSTNSGGAFARTDGVRQATSLGLANPRPAKIIRPFT